MNRNGTDTLQFQVQILHLLLPFIRSISLSTALSPLCASVSLLWSLSVYNMEDEKPVVPDTEEQQLGKWHGLSVACAPSTSQHAEIFWRPYVASPISLSPKQLLGEIE